MEDICQYIRMHILKTEQMSHKKLEFHVLYADENVYHDLDAFPTEDALQSLSAYVKSDKISTTVCTFPW